MKERATSDQNFSSAELKHTLPIASLITSHQSLSALPSDSLPSRSLSAIVPHSLANSLGSFALTTPTLHGNYLVAKAAQIQTQIRPCIEMVCDRDSTACTRRLSDRDILIKGRGSFDGRCIVPGVLVDGVLGSITVNAALVGAKAWRAGGILYDVVFHKRICAPTVDGEESGSRAHTKIS